MEFLSFIKMPSMYYWLDSIVELPCVLGNGEPSDTYVRRRQDEVQKLVNVTWWYYVESMEIWLIQQTLFLGSPLFLKIIAERLMVSRTTSLLLGDTAQSQFSSRNLKLKEDVTLSNIMNSRKEIFSKETDLNFMNKKFQQFL